jgi:hypothetical protein
LALQAGSIQNALLAAINRHEFIVAGAAAGGTSSVIIEAILAEGRARKALVVSRALPDNKVCLALVASRVIGAAQTPTEATFINFNGGKLFYLLWQT